MKKTLLPVVLAPVLALPALCAMGQAMGTVHGNADTGALLFYQHGCYECHGFSGYGRQDLNNTGSPILINEDVFRAYLRGRQNEAPLLPSTQMPNYPANALSDSQVGDIYAYIRSMPANLPETGDVPTLQAILEAAERPYRP